MMGIHLRGTFDSVLNEMGGNPFCIFGQARQAQVFYLYCKEKNKVQDIKAFIVSDMTRVVRKIPMLHGIPIKDIHWLQKQGNTCNLFLAAREKTVQEQLAPMLSERLEGNAYYVSDFTNNIMCYRYMHLYYEDILSRYMVSKNIYDEGYLNIWEPGSENRYKYWCKVGDGVRPDLDIFNGNVGIDHLYARQLGDYHYLNGREEEPLQRESQNHNRFKIYMVKSHFDRELKEEFYTPYTETIQAGAALTEERISEIQDDIGENISIRNRDYCEMSAVYWIWKNEKESDYIGLCHYRRRFVIDENVVSYMISHKYDAVYTVPKLTDGGLRDEFVERYYFLTPDVWEQTEKAVKKLSPDYYEAWKSFGKSYFNISCNMFIMRRRTFEDYFSWLFPILEEVDRHYMGQGRQCNNRYLGYIAEMLNTVYVMKNKDKLKKGFVEMKMLL